MASKFINKPKQVLGYLAMTMIAKPLIFQLLAPKTWIMKNRLRVLTNCQKRCERW